jgi:predicted dehydrogenase
MKKFGVIVVGAGLMGRWHARAARRAGARILAVVDVNAGRAAALAAAHPGARAFDTLAAALGKCDPLACHVCTPLPTHADLATESLEAGLHVLVEKPFTDSLESTRTLLELAESKGRLAIPVHQFPHQRGVRRAYAFLPRIGPLRQVGFVACSAGAAGGTATEADRVAAEILPHPLSLLEHLLPGVLAKTDWQVTRPTHGEWLAQSSADGVGIQLLISMGGRPPVNELRLIGERGSVTCDLFHGYAGAEAGAVSRTRKMLRPFSRAIGHGARAGANLVHRTVTGEFAYPGLDSLVREFYLAVAGSGPSPAGVEEILAIAAAHQRILAAAESAA